MSVIKFPVRVLHIQIGVFTVDENDINTVSKVLNIKKRPKLQFTEEIITRK